MKVKKSGKRVKSLKTKSLSAKQAKLVKGGYDDGFGPMKPTGQKRTSE